MPLQTMWHSLTGRISVLATTLLEPSLGCLSVDSTSLTHVLTFHVDIKRINLTISTYI